MQNEKKSNVEFIPQFDKAFYHPRYWGVWLGTGLMAGISLVPARMRDPLLGAIGKLAGKVAKGARRRARINLLYCMPELPEQQREHIIDEMFATAPQSMILMAELACTKPEKVLKRVRWHGEDVLDKIREEGRNVIFLVPHGWAVDVPAMLMAARGQPMAAMFHNQSNPLVDYLWNSVRRKFGGRMHARNDGIKPFISSVRHGYWGYYLPDQDHGAEHSEFVDFFATYKATLPAVGRLMKVCKAAIVPLFPVYDGKTSMLDIYIREPMDDLAEADDVRIARRMNEEVENLVGPNPEQYTWILKLLKTRKEGEIEPYSRDDLYR
ncbi:MULTISPECIES: lauroyl-Kdo(2)-lipid IV(A) myristoyltransferase [Serratia]|uniref:Lipid A biosynthesis acyltransferase n=1 Tax=Serratia fonticola TaxID=47917 RepID=A0AAJ1YEW6_SERFO|nr:MULTISPECIES: lauroyl-Kdo(2)-lipid IV(A) myristoyltransferase [Serratia]MBE0148337.1 lauroyl-Kdo(2)-lipid IV(A) myristoyltransferase [Serratia fonticola]MDQ7208101.1 lauroyl-Kdo(2)-lipid IV(A) myristoyltransferase [Serratia fonticola]MDQ9129243.1 lauroyl-Kdo(2)-lipid IV(A) myristoyltransferase [Serratia fonticola]OKP30140.1 lipid A biosynthesis (KDO)2-(lauroyl)-lipid IVA acyltransferase [Serratia fonticola]HBE9079910.1 lauroyl-Kdo(2)-lipid IV(A) myristoyltransferase [Serratia fonticola]